MEERDTRDNLSIFMILWEIKWWTAARVRPSRDTSYDIFYNYILFIKPLMSHWLCQKCFTWAKKNMENMLFTVISFAYEGLKVQCSSSVFDQIQPIKQCYMWKNRATIVLCIGCLATGCCAKVWRRCGKAYNPSCFRCCVKFPEFLSCIKSKVRSKVPQGILRNFVFPSAL